MNVDLIYPIMLAIVWSSFALFFKEKVGVWITLISTISILNFIHFGLNKLNWPFEYYGLVSYIGTIFFIYSTIMLKQSLTKRSNH